MMKPILNAIISLGVFAGLCFGLARLVPPAAETSRELAIPLGHGEERTPSQFIEEISARRPSVLWIGSSLARNADPDQMETLLGKPCYRIRINSSGSALWYLALKNIAAMATPKPAVVVIFFVDTELTWSSYRIETEGQRQGIDALKRPEDAWLLMRCANYGATDPVDYLLRETFTAYAERDYLKTSAIDAVKRNAVRPLGEQAAGSVDDILARVFEPSRMDPSLLNAMQQAKEQANKGMYDFGRNVNKSFLPHMIDAAKSAGIPLAFARIKRLRDAEPGKQPPELQAYIRDLRAFVESRGASLFDFSEDPRLSLDFFTDGDHVDEQGQIITTVMLAEKLAPFFPDTPDIVARIQGVRLPGTESSSKGAGLVACQGSTNLIPNGSFINWKSGEMGSVPEHFFHAFREALPEEKIPSRIKPYDGPEKINGVFEEWNRPLGADALFRCLGVMVENTAPGTKYKLSAVADNRTKGFVQLRVWELEPQEGGLWKPVRELKSGTISLSRQGGFRRYATSFETQKGGSLLIFSLAPPQESATFPVQVVWKEWCLSAP